jgi:choline kinase
VTDNLKLHQSVIQSTAPKCIILAAGASTRLRPLTDAKPKCLLEVGGKTLLERTLINILESGIKDIALVIGYRGEMVRDFIKQSFPRQRIRFILNPNYAVTNNAYSLLLARKFLENKEGRICSGILLLDSDILFPKKILPLMLCEPIESRVAVRVSGEHNTEEVRVKINREGRIMMIGKNIPLEETYGESVGIEVFSSEMTNHLFSILERRVRNGTGRTEFYEASFQEMIDERSQLETLDVSAFPVIEIDTPEDLLLAEQLKTD